MNLATLELIRDELAAVIVGRRLGKVIPLSRSEIAFDLRLTDSRYLFISLDPSDPAVFLIRRRLRDLEKASANPSPFVLLLKKYLSGFEIEKVEKWEGERVLMISLTGETETGVPARYRLIAQLTGRSANLFLSDDRGFIIDSLRQTNGEGQTTGTCYSPPSRSLSTNAAQQDAFPKGEHPTLSDALDQEFLRRRAKREFESALSAARARVNSEIAKRERLLKALESDLKAHGDAERWKKYGDLLLANIATAKRSDSKVSVTDYYDDSQAVIDIDVDDNDSLTEAAEKFFKRYTKARNARAEIEKRRNTVSAELRSLQEEAEAIETATEKGEFEQVIDLSGTKRPVKDKTKPKVSPVSSWARTFISSDGFQILVGKKSKDNDYLTFRAAKSLDTWMHAADYPGSHVVIRNPDRREIPQRTLHEAAKLAAFYSKGRTQPKAAVHYTQKKFVNKPKGAAPGLVSLASFKTLLVEPGVPDSVVNKDKA